MKKLLLFSLSMACFAMASVAQNAANKVSKVYENRIQVRETVKPHFQMPESKMELVCNKPEKSLNLSSGRFGGLFDVENGCWPHKEMTKSKSWIAYGISTPKVPLAIPPKSKCSNMTSRAGRCIALSTPLMELTGSSLKKTVSRMTIMAILSLI